MAGPPKWWKHKAAVWSLAGARVLIPILACVVTGVLDAEIRPPASEISAYFGRPYLLRRPGGCSLHFAWAGGGCTFYLAWPKQGLPDHLTLALAFSSSILLPHVQTRRGILLLGMTVSVLLGLFHTITVLREGGLRARRRGALAWDHFAARHGCSQESEPSISQSLNAYNECGALVMDFSSYDHDGPLVGFSILNQEVSIFGPHIAELKWYTTPVLSDLNALADQVELPNVKFLAHLTDGGCFSADSCRAIFATEKRISEPCVRGVFMPPRSSFYFISRAVIGDQFVSEEVNVLSARISTDRVPFHRKLDKAFFRGSTTGGVYNADNWRVFPRSRIVQVSLDFPHLLDARFSEVLQVSDPSVRIAMEAAGFLGSSVPQEEQYEYKLIVVPDGNSVPDRLMGQLASNSVVLKSESDNAEYWYSELVPWEHYIPFKQDASDLAAVIESVLKNETLLRYVAQKSTAFVLARLNPSRIMCYWGLLLREYAARMSA